MNVIRMAEDVKGKPKQENQKQEPKASIKPATKPVEHPIEKPAEKAVEKQVQDKAPKSGADQRATSPVAEAKPAVAKGRKTASSKVKDDQVSLIHSRIVLGRIRNLQLKKAKNIIEGMVLGKVSLNHKYYTKTCVHILSLLQNAEANAKAKGMDEGKLYISEAKADKGRTFVRPRSKNSLSGNKARMSHITIVLSER
jgi:ribosomal protein L22